MRKHKELLLILAGAVLILSALSLVLFNRHKDEAAGEAADHLLGIIQSAIDAIEPPLIPESPPQSQAPPPDSLIPPAADSSVAPPDSAPLPPASAPPSTEAPPPVTEAETQDPTMKELFIDGYGYIGYIHIESLDITLPIMSKWDYDRLDMAPCRQFGSVKTDDLVIAAHNYVHHFGPLRRIKPGAFVVIVDMEGKTHTYQVKKVDTLNPTEVDAVQNSGYDLVLYTCTLGVNKRITVFCDRAL